MSDLTGWDVVVVGAGPAGSATASLLARRGFRVLLVDRAVFPRPKACGEYTSPQTEEVLRRLGALEAVERAGARRLDAMRVVGPSGRAFTIDYSREAGCPKTVLATTRWDLDAALVDHARAKGAQVWERTRVEGVIVEDGAVRGVALRQGNGPASEVAARLVIGADGTHSVVARSLGLTAPVVWPRSLGMVAHYRGYDGLESWGEMHVSADGYAGLAPQSRGLLNVGLVMPMNRSRPSERLSAGARFEKFAFSFPAVAKALRGAERVEAVRGAGPIGARVRRTYGAGFLLVGDAAGFFDPFTGEGVYKALRGAELAATVAAGALTRNDLTAAALERYRVLRRREFAAKDLFCRVVQLFVALPGLFDYLVARVDSRPAVRRVLAGVVGDYADARVALSPRYLLSLMRP